jgi:hypothetical protein
MLCSFCAGMQSWRLRSDTGFFRSSMGEIRLYLLEGFLRHTISRYNLIPVARRIEIASCTRSSSKFATSIYRSLPVCYDSGKFLIPRHDIVLAFEFVLISYLGTTFPSLCSSSVSSLQTVKCYQGDCLAYAMSQINWWGVIWFMLPSDPNSSQRKLVHRLSDPLVACGKLAMLIQFLVPLLK